MTAMKILKEIEEVPKKNAQIVAGAKNGNEEKPASVLTKNGTPRKLKVAFLESLPSSTSRIVSARRDSS